MLARAAAASLATLLCASQPATAALPRKAPAQITITMGCGVMVYGSLDKSMLRRVIRRHLNEIQNCYQKGLQQQPALEGRVELWFRILPSGELEEVRVTGPADGQPQWRQLQTLQSADSAQGSTAAPQFGTQPGVLSCIADAVHKWRFPAVHAPRSAVEVTYPLLLKPSDPPQKTPAPPGGLQITDEELAAVGALPNSGAP